MIWLLFVCVEMIFLTAGHAPTPGSLFVRFHLSFLADLLADTPGGCRLSGVASFSVDNLPLPTYLGGRAELYRWSSATLVWHIGTCTEMLAATRRGENGVPQFKKWKTKNAFGRFRRQLSKAKQKKIPNEYRTNAVPQIRKKNRVSVYICSGITTHSSCIHGKNLYSIYIYISLSLSKETLLPQWKW